ncbi:MAG: WD40/YVTN/BNR-like repeat-containing protein, partial [Gemmataceae bacterium]
MIGRTTLNTRLLSLLIAASLAGCGSPPPAPWQRQSLATDARLRGLSAVSPDVAWVSGTGGTFGRTTDGGRTWAVGTVNGAEKLDLRDIEASDASTAFALSAGPGDQSRIYKTADGGQTWALQFTNADPKGFFDAIAFWDARNGIAMGDPVGGRFQLLVTDDGATWRPIGGPPALPDEGAFAASGTCLVTHGANDVWFATGGAKVARAFHSADRGRTWTASGTPVAAGVATAGIFGIAFRDRDHGIVVGGDYKKESDTGATAAVTADGGKTWALTRQKLPFRSAVAWANGRWV